MTVSVLILTLNEEVNIEGCLQSVSWSDDVVVLDSHSTDRTREIVAKHRARVIVRPFDDYASQRNFGLKEIPFRHEWILMIDADERVTPELRAEIECALGSVDNETTLFAMRRKDFLLGKWIKRSSLYPTWFARLARHGRVWVERACNEEYRTDGKTVFLEQHLHHYPFNKGFSAWFIKHDRYSTMEAQLMLAGSIQYFDLKDLFSRDPTRRRRALKALVYSLPGRPLIIFVGSYLFRGAIFEGRAGLTFCLLRATYEFMISCKLDEARRRAKGLPV